MREDGDSVGDAADDKTTSTIARGRALLERASDGATWRSTGALGALLVLTLVVATAYGMKPQSPRDLLDRVQLAFGSGTYGPNLRVGERWLARALRADAAGADSLADEFRWRATRPLARAVAGASGPREEIAANDRLADVYLDLGWRRLERGRGRMLGLGRRWDSLAAAEQLAACIVGLAPTQRRSEINAFVTELEKALDRPAAGRCPE